MIAWIPEFIIWGKPKIIDIWIDSAYSVALARDVHYSNPPDYIIVEPEDTSERTANLQQSNTNGYKLQETDIKKIEKAKQTIAKYGSIDPKENYKAENQKRLQQLFKRYKYRLDTNFAKMDRIEHETLEDFKVRVLDLNYYDFTIKEWSKLLKGSNTINAEEENKMLEKIINMGQ